MRNKIFSKVISFVLIISILFSLSCTFSVSAATKTGYITENGVRVRTTPTSVPSNNFLTNNGSKILLYYGHELTILNTVTSDGDTSHPTWHHVRFTYSGKSYEGYVTAAYVKVNSQSTSGTVDLDKIPDIYKSYIQQLSADHPNWNFVIQDTGVEWADLFTLDAQGYVGRSLILYTYPLSYRSTQSGAYVWETDTWVSQDAGGWYQANQQTIAYFMDPRNFLNEKNIFMFESLKYDSATHNINGVEAIIDNSFMDGTQIKNNDGKNVTYSQAYIDAAIASNVSPYHLASRTIQEVSKSGSTATNGNHSQYPGIYNFYSIHATQGGNPIAKGLAYASGETATSAEKTKYNMPWDTPYKAIVGGAKWIGNGYINNNQHTLYYQKFNSYNKVWYHQYMGNLAAPQSESLSVYNSYKNLNSLENSFTFVIPYYRNMPANPCALPASSNASPNNWLKSLTVDGYSFDFYPSTTSGYSIQVPNSVSKVKINATTVNSNATVSGAGTVSLNEGSNLFNIKVTAQNGDIRTYAIQIVRSTTNNVPLKGISLNKSELSMFNGDTQVLTVSYNPSNTTDSKLVTWSSSDTSVCTVSNGTVVAIGRGQATITAKVGNYTATCHVTVSNDIKIGDVDSNGVVTLTDALMIFKYKTNEITLSSSALKAADTDRNGKVELADALRIFKYKSGEIDSL